MKRGCPEHFCGHHPARVSCFRQGFSLIELLIVINITAYILWLTIPAFFSITSASRVSEAAFGISSAVERARSEAITRHTYVWLGLQEESSEQLLGIRVGLVASMDGTANTNSTNLASLGPTQLYKGVGFSDGAVAALSIPGSNPVLLSDFSGGLSFGIGSRSFIQRRTITFLPMGEVTTNASPGSLTGFVPLIVIPIREAHGTNLFPGNDAAVVIDGSVGNPLIFRK